VQKHQEEMRIVPEQTHAASAQPAAAPATPRPEWQGDFLYGAESGLDGGHLRLGKTRKPVVVFLDTIHPDKFPGKLPYVQSFKSRIEELSGLPCLALHYTYLDRVDLEKPVVKAIALDANWTPIARYQKLLYAFIRKTTIPMIATCGGHQQMCEAYGGTVDMMRPLRPGEADPNPRYFPGYFKEWAFMPVKIIKNDALFDGLPDPFIVQQYHVAEVKTLPAGFEILASTDECRVQAIRRHEKLHYSTQFHPEDYNAEHLHGRVLLQNFFRLAGATIPMPR
jgi:GMP synthase-like glutamine amidotransferase